MRTLLNKLLRKKKSREDGSITLIEAAVVMSLGMVFIVYYLIFMGNPAVSSDKGVAGRIVNRDRCIVKNFEDPEVLITPVSGTVNYNTACIKKPIPSPADP
ncbi:MAG: hypothetical protein KDD42_00795 [Bdellovibrionales bacterium]|nr:hypothetical protein [Bdellovibrionales bacterium]